MIPFTHSIEVAYWLKENNLRDQWIGIMTSKRGRYCAKLDSAGIWLFPAGDPPGDKTVRFRKGLFTL